jgi:hypothetical protein
MFDKYKKNYEDEGLKNKTWITADGERAVPPPKNPSTKLSDTLGTPTTVPTNTPGKGGWQSTLDDTINKILNREKFSYNFNEDALYQQYKDMFGRQAKASAENAIGQASALTGGYGNSYAQSVGQQMYSKEMQGLNDVIPELYDLAYNKYQQEGQDLYNQYGLLSAERDFDYKKALDERNFDYQKYLDDRDYKYQAGRDLVSDYQWLIGQTPEVEETVSPTIIPSREYWKGDYDINPSGYTYYVNGKEVTVGYNVNPFTGNTNPDTANGTIEGRPYQPNNVEGKPLTKTKATDVINGKEEPIWVDEDGNKWIWNDMTNEYDLYKE